MKKKIVGLMGLIFLLVAGVGIWKAPFSNKEEIRVKDEKKEEKEQSNNEEQSEIESISDLIDGEYSFEDIDTSTWQTYRNEKMGFQIKIPDNWYANEENEGACLREKDISYKFEGSTNVCAIYINVDDRHSSQRTNFREFITKRKQYYKENVQITEIDNVHAVVSGSKYLTNANFFKNSGAWSISVGVNPSSYPEVVKIHSGILRTFKFIQ